MRGKTVPWTHRFQGELTLAGGTNLSPTLDFAVRK
jgi:hypothetical protein